MADLPAVLTIVKEATRHMNEKGIFQWDDLYPSRDVLADDIQKQQMHLIEFERQIAGVVVINEEQSPEYGDIGWEYFGRVMVVHRLTIGPTFQRRGLATHLMDFAEANASGRYDCIRLDAFAKNPSAIALYEKRGYRKAGLVHFRKGAVLLL